MISFDNRFKLKAEYLGIEKSPEEEITLVSHAHSDHIPSRYSKNKILCSQITKKMIKWRRNPSSIISYKNQRIKMLDAGHVLGSKMFLINGLLYTGDFNTKSLYVKKAKPIKCHTLIIECTYGKPKYVFPSKESVIKDLIDYIKENKKVIIITLDSGFGKPQEICHALDDLKINFKIGDRIKKVNKLLGLKFKKENEKSNVIISDSYSSYNLDSSYKKVILTGWAINKFMHQYDKAFPFSSHCDYLSLIEFVKACNPKKIYTTHGYEEEFAHDLRKIGFNAFPLSNLIERKNKEYQATLTSL